MENRGDQVVENETEASAGSKEGVVRWVLIIGLLLAVVFLSIIWMTGALIQDDGADTQASVSRTIQAEDAANERGEPIAPDFEAADTNSGSRNGMLATEENTAKPAPDSTMVGDAPAGDPKPDGM